MGPMTGYAIFFRVMHIPDVQYLLCMASQAVAVYRFDAGMRFMAFITIEPSHRDLRRE
jgi:hypothetical protein